MSRDFEMEYEQHMNTQVPDLWARIEANLPAKEVPKVIQLEQRKGKSKRWMNFGMTAAAALLICVLAIPVMRSGLGSKMESANFTARNVAYDMCVEDVAEVVIEAYMEADAEMDTVKEAGMSNGENYGFDADGGNSATGAAGYSADTENGAYDVAVPETVAQEEEVTEVLPETDDAVSDKAKETVTAMWAEATIWEVFEEDGNVLYKADITGQEVVLVLGEKLAGKVTLEVGKMYQLTLEVAGEDATWDYVVVEM